MASSGLINLEFTWGKWNGDDVRGLEDPLMGVVTRAGGWCTIFFQVHLFID
jgi:hypothetical protein